MKTPIFYAETRTKTLTDVKSGRNHKIVSHQEINSHISPKKLLGDFKMILPFARVKNAPRGFP